tara:strand:- start:916 stop:1428 length:513 start_codon:yes stop_codon:yes gene_type:complete
MPSKLSDDLREILNNHKSDIERLKTNIKETTNNLTKLQEKHNKLLEKVMEISGNWKQPFPNLSNIPSKPIQPQQPIANIKPSIFGMSDLQFLILLEKGKATNPNFAVSAIQLKLAYGINRSERTVRNKLLELEYKGYISTTGTRPKQFYLNSEGQELISKQKRETISFEL